MPSMTVPAAAQALPHSGCPSTQVQRASPAEGLPQRRDVPGDHRVAARQPGGPFIMPPVVRGAQRRRREGQRRLCEAARQLSDIWHRRGAKKEKTARLLESHCSVCVPEIRSFPY